VLAWLRSGAVVIRFETVRAKAGAALLDLLRPGWAAEIRVNILQLSSCHSCILGQLFGNFFIGAEQIFALRVSEEDKKNPGYGSYVRSQLSTPCEAAGFVLPDHFRNKEYDMAYANLTKAWKKEITKRTRVAAVNV